jgi:murein DD-endopeptidase MepM/ murein hydrolase activator NlpD
MGSPRIILLLFALASSGFLHAQRIDIGWPTPNRAWAEGKDYSAWVQPTVSGDPESGMFGCVRSHGTQFHEGLDIRPVARDARGEPADPIFAAMDGVVRYVNNHAGESNYGRYIVIEHPEVTPAVYTLYAHLARIEPGVGPGVRVKKGQTIALMGHTAGGGGIPRDRAHMHFEIGLMVTTNFPSWYVWKKFGSPNEHGLYNGMNLMGFDPYDFLQEWRHRKVDNFQQYLDRMRGVVRVRVATARTPDFISRYPSLLRRPLPAGPVAGWEIECNSTGLPFAWTPLGPLDVMDIRPNSARIVSVEDAAVRAYRCKSLVKSRSSGYVPGTDLEEMLQQVFGLR